MGLTNNVHWYEGLLLQPQHFQQHDRFLESVVQQTLTAMHGNTWGFIDLQLDCDHLATGQIGVNSAKGCFPDGTVFQLPQRDHVPNRYSFDVGMDQTMVYLALPEDQSQRYHIQTVQLETEIQVCELACQLLTDKDDLSGYTVLPIANIKTVNSNQQVLLNNDFYVPCLHINVNRSLCGKLETIYQLLSSRKSSITETGLLQIVNRYLVIFHHYLQQNPLHPYDVYCSLVQLYAECSVFHREKPDALAFNHYQHHNLNNCFNDVILQVMDLLNTVLQKHSMLIEIQSESSAMWIGCLPDEQIIYKNDFVLAVQADVSLIQLRRELPSQIKIAPKNQISMLVQRALPGVEIESISVAPRQIPTNDKSIYFLINKQNPYWQSILKDKQLALHVSGHFPGLQMELWVIN